MKTYKKIRDNLFRVCWCILRLNSWLKNTDSDTKKNNGIDTSRLKPTLISGTKTLRWVSTRKNTLVLWMSSLSRHTVVSVPRLRLTTTTSVNNVSNHWTQPFSITSSARIDKGVHGPNGCFRQLGTQTRKYVALTCVSSREQQQLKQRVFCIHLFFSSF